MNTGFLSTVMGAVLAMSFTGCVTKEPPQDQPEMLSPTEYRLRYEIDRVHKANVGPFMDNFPISPSQFGSPL
jgi:hypothetical protein